MTEWILIVLLKGTVPPVGVVVYGFPTEQACKEEAVNYCAPEIRKRICKCEREVNDRK